MGRKVLYRKEPLAGVEYHPEILGEIPRNDGPKNEAECKNEPKNGMTEEDVEKARAALARKEHEAGAAWAEANMRFVDYIAQLVRTHTLTPEREQGELMMVDWFTGQRFPRVDAESIKARFGEHLELLRRVGSRCVTSADIGEVARIIRRVRGDYRATSTAEEYLGVRGHEKGNGRIIVGRKPGRSYAIAAIHEVCRNGSVTLQGRNVGKVRAIAEVCRLAWPELKQLGIRNGSENVNGVELRHIEIQLGV